MNTNTILQIYHQTPSIQPTMQQQQQQPQTWTRPNTNYTISTDKTLLCLSSINAAFAADWMYWTQSLPEETLRQMIENSFCFGLYRTPPTPASADTELEQVGFARLVTDNISFAYLTDLYVLPEYQGQGLGAWMIDCVDEVLRGMQYLRWVMLRTASEESKLAYEKRLSMRILAEGEVRKGVVMGRRGGGCMV